MKTFYKNIVMGLVLSTMLTGCNTWSRLTSIGKEPELAPIENPTTQPNYQPVSLPMPPVADSLPDGANSLWKRGSSGFFKDQRASKVGDIITVNIRTSYNIWYQILHVSPASCSSVYYNFIVFIHGLDFKIFILSDLYFI